MRYTIPPYDGKYAQHLWHSTIKGKRYLNNLDINLVCHGNSVYYEMLRFALNETDWYQDHCQDAVKRFPT